MVSTSGHTLLESDAISTLKEFLLPLATVVTPNLPEGYILANKKQPSGEASSPETSTCCRRSTIVWPPTDFWHEVQEICRVIAAQGPSYVLLKGGHSEAEGLLDVFYDKKNDTFSTFRHQ